MKDMFTTKTFSLKLSQLQLMDELSQFTGKNYSELFRDMFDTYIALNQDLVRKAKKEGGE
ncbi:MAG: hypothetical protein ACOCP8_03625 [archaeon]